MIFDVSRPPSLITPALDPLTNKNRPLSAHRLTGILCNAGLMLQHNPVLPGPFAKPALRLQPDGSFGPAVQPDEIGLLFRPTVTQISRWDRLKGWKPLLDAFTQLKQQYPALEELSEVQKRRFSLCRLVLAGPEPAAVADDPEAKDVLEELIQGYVALPKDVQAFGISGGVGEGLKRLFMTHPPLEERIAALRNY